MEYKNNDKSYDKNYELVEVELDVIEPLEDTIAPSFGIYCTCFWAFGIHCG